MTTSTEQINPSARQADIKQWFAKFKSWNTHRQWLVGSLVIGSVLLLLIAILLLVTHDTSNVSQLTRLESKQAITLLRQLRNIDSQLQVLSVNPQSSTEFKNALATLNTEVVNLQQSINSVAKSADIQKITSQMTAMQEEVDLQLLDLKRTVANGQATKQYLDSKILPFHVISIDVIAQQPFVSIDYAHHITPLAIGDTVAGWQIASADYDAAQVEFKNDKNQYVKVALQG